MTRTARLPALAFGLGALAIGFVLGWTVRPSPGTPPIDEASAPDGDPVPPSTAIPPPTAILPAEVPTGTPSTRLAAAPIPPQAALPSSDGSLESRLRAALGGDPSPAAVDRARALRDVIVSSAAAEAAKSVARDELARREALRVEAAGEMPRLLAHLRERPTTVAEIAADGARMRSLLTHPAKGPRTPSSDLKALASADTADGTTLLLPEGKLEFPRIKTLAAGLTISGLGIDRTFVDGELEAQGTSLLSLTVEDLTLTGQDVFDAKGVLTLTLRRVRAAGYNSGAGGSSFLDVRQSDMAILCEDCVFDGIVGSRGREKGPERHGTPFSLSGGAKLLRFEGCTFLGNATPVQTWGSATIHFQRCTFRGNAAARVSGAVYVECVFEDNGDDARR